jgi:hypothetical protein
MLRDNIKKYLKEVTSDNSSGRYSSPMQPSLRIFNKTQLAPFNIEVSDFQNAELYVDSLDGNMDETENEIRKMESLSKKIARYKKNHPTITDDDGDNINPYPSKINEWVEINEDTVAEDLAVWFGKKKKPKGSKQPKGPWVNICRKDKNGKHPPCGRSEAGKGGYPKCRAAGVAGKMTDSQKRAACAQKRRAEKKDTQTGKGQKPIMTSYKSKNESTMRIVKLTENDLRRIVKKIILENENPKSKLSMYCSSLNGDGIKITDVTFDKFYGNDQVKKLEVSYSLNKRPLDSPYGGEDSKKTFILNVEKIKDEKLKSVMGVNGNDNNTLVNYVGQSPYYCSVTKSNPDWDVFFREKNIHKGKMTNG